jgi:hypothetical protein
MGSVSPLGDADASRAKKVSALLDWLDGEELSQIERCRQIAPGAAVRLATRTAWLFTAMADIAALTGWSNARSDQLRDLARRLGDRPAIAAAAFRRPECTLRRDERPLRGNRDDATGSGSATRRHRAAA